MIEVLRISSLAIIDELTLEFDPGLNCITGETGAGKSLIIGSLSLLMGSRSNAGLVRPDRDRAVIEALFVSGDEELLLRREIFASGRSRAYINGDLATNQQMTSRAAEHLHIYGQHQYQDLLNPQQHMHLLENLAHMDRSAVDESYGEYRRLDLGYRELADSIERNVQERENLAYALAELEACELVPGLEERLEKECTLAGAAAELQDASLQAGEILYSRDSSIIDQLAQVRELLARMARHDAEMEPLCGEVERISAQVEDLNLRLREREYDWDPQRLDELEARLHDLRSVKRKHGCDEQGLLSLREEMTRRLELVSDSSRLLEEARVSRDVARETYVAAVNVFLDERRLHAARVSERINRDLADMGMQGTEFAVRQESHVAPEAVTVAGHTPATVLNGEFMIATNVGQHLQPLHKVASGGELSRIMLAIKVQQGGDDGATMIFDEIDAGISGQTAFMIADKLASLAGEAQTIVVTHLHQAAARADMHFVVRKDDDGVETRAHVSPVDGERRVHELARMMGGETPSPVVLKHAAELLESRC